MTPTDAEAATREASPHLFSADRPISSRSEDLLGRTPYARNLAKAIEGWRQKDSLVIAMYGPWGVGKTSLKNLVVEELGGELAIVEFNPWQWSGQERIAQAFFEHLARGIARSPARGSDRLRARWVAIRVRNYARLLDVAAAGLGLAGRVGVLLASLVSPDTRRGLVRAKAGLAALLRKLDRPILVVIDDLDRLTAEEIRLVFQLVKANADLPNLVYLLLFERAVVEKALETPGVSGREFLEKIVQVGFDVPQPERSRIDAVLFRELDELLRLPGMEERWDQQRWARLFFDGVQPLVHTLRHVRRFAGVLSFQVSLLRQEGTLEVNPIDLIGVEALRVFAPAVHRALWPAKPELITLTPGLAGSGFGSKEPEAEARRSAIRSLVGMAEDSMRPAVEAIIKELFPTARWAFGEPRYARMDDAWVRELRICVPAFFDRYFLLAVPERDVSQSELDALLAAAGDRDATVGRLRALQSRGLLDIALERLMAHRSEIDPGHAVPFVTALFDLGDELPHEARGLIALSPLDHAHFLIRGLLRRLPDERARAEVVRNAAQSSQGLSLPVLVVARAEQRASDPDPGSSLFEPAGLRGLVDLCLEKIRAAASSGRLAQGPGLLEILYQWERWSPGEPEQWVAELIRSKDGLLTFLRGCVTRVVSQTAGNYLPGQRYEIRLRDIEQFVSVEELSSAVAGLAQDELGPEDRRAIEAYRRALQRRAQGKADDDRDAE